MRFIVVLVLILVQQSLWGQSWFNKEMRGKKTDSFIITLEGDTIPGKVEFDNPYKMAKRISFFPDQSDEEERYKPFDIEGFAVYGKVWKSKKIKIPSDGGFGGYSRRVDVFLLPVVEDGPIELFYHYYNGYFVSLEGNYIPAYAYVAIKEDGESAYLSADEDWLYDNEVFYLVQDCEELVAGIQSEEYAWDDLVTLVNRYNQFMEEKKEDDR